MAGPEACRLAGAAGRARRSARLAARPETGEDGDRLALLVELVRPRRPADGGVGHAARRHRAQPGQRTPALRRLPESSRLPLRAAIVGRRPVRVKPGLRAFRVHRGELLHYLVALTNTGRSAFRFAPASCPVYIEQLEPAAPQVYVLNCRPAPTIAPRATVLFAMQIRVPDTAPTRVASLTWELAPRTYVAPFATAALSVSP